MLRRVDPLALGRSVIELGSAVGLRPFFDRLHRGEAVSIGLLGASVGQSGGCLSQPYKRCMLYRGVRPSLEGYSYEPTRAGYLLQLFGAINRSWPHPQHAVFNAATDGIRQVDMYRHSSGSSEAADHSGLLWWTHLVPGCTQCSGRVVSRALGHLDPRRPLLTPGTPVDATLPCLFSHLPHEVHLVVLEFGSMARYTTVAAVEATLRVLLSLPSRPAIVHPAR